MNLEVKILSDTDTVKSVLKRVCSFYQEDFLLNDVIFVTVDNISKLATIRGSIHIRKEGYAYQ